MFCVRPVLLWRRMPWIVLSSKIVQVRRESAAESVPAVPRGKGIVALEYVASGLCSSSDFRQTVQRKIWHGEPNPKKNGPRELKQGILHDVRIRRTR